MFSHSLFQFHKVRLKALVAAISLGIVLFQFHKVRLKAYLQKFLKGIELFQFHKVRLKAYQSDGRNQDEDWFQFHKVRCFNSIRYD